ncbi:hypothetical protein JCM15548_14816 [Geofilum rubicundum JCM 15548]|uniref:Transposase n=1 Tax=Geofilum rubicundum JCM 15548 TaxID=1236989 RepID=A0A0E9LS22_9BACT|nr:hypothetical protein JCM15548_14816 [Geofilum rubicundum JCM 15548]
MGLLSLAKKHDQADFLKACNKALSLNRLTYKFVKNMLLNKTFELSTEEQSDLYLIPEHTNLRGKEQFN